MPGATASDRPTRRARCASRLSVSVSTATIPASKPASTQLFQRLLVRDELVVRLHRGSRLLVLAVPAQAGEDRGETLFLQEWAQPCRVQAGDGKSVQVFGDGRIVPQQHKLPRDARQVGELDQVAAPLGLADFFGPREQRIEVSVFADQLRRRLDADSRNARHIVAGIAGKGLHIDNLLGRHAEALDHLRVADPALFHRVEQRYPFIDKLHQVLVGGDDRDLGAELRRPARIGRDDVVRLIAGQFGDLEVQRPYGVPDQRELRHEFRRRVRAVRLVVGVDVVAEGRAGHVEHDGDPVGIGILDQPHQHGREAIDGVDGGAVGPRHRRQGMEGAEDVAGAVDQEDVAGRAPGQWAARRSAPSFSTKRRPQ